MIEYKLLDKDDHRITLDNYGDMSKIMTDIFPGMPLDVNKMYELIRETRGINGEAFHVYCRDRDTRIFIPKEYDELYKERLEVLAGYKFERVKCQ